MQNEFQRHKIKAKISFQYLELFWSQARMHTGFLGFWNPIEFSDNCFNPFKTLDRDLMFHS